MGEGGLGGCGGVRLRRAGSDLLDAVQTPPMACSQALPCDRGQAARFGRFLADGTVGLEGMLAHAG